MYLPQLTLFGEGSREGTYLLVIRLERPVEVAFGSFRKGRPFGLEPGWWLYVGSALGARKGGSPLASRLLRHASRSGRKRAHAIRRPMARCFVEAGLLDGMPGKRPPKRLRWHADYLLDRLEAEIVHVGVVRSPVRLEGRLARLIEGVEGVSAPVRGVGAVDCRGDTHLLRAKEPAGVLQAVREALSSPCSLLSAEQGADEAVTVEKLQVVDFFTHADVLDRQFELP